MKNSNPSKVKDLIDKYKRMASTAIVLIIIALIAIIISVGMKLFAPDDTKEFIESEAEVVIDLNYNPVLDKYSK